MTATPLGPVDVQRLASSNELDREGLNFYLMTEIEPPSETFAKPKREDGKYSA
jgi:hypothetical protein